MRLIVTGNESLLIMTQSLQSLRLENLTILGIKDVQLLLIRIISLYKLTLTLCSSTTHFIFLILVWFKSRDAIYDSYCARAVNSR